MILAHGRGRGVKTDWKASRRGRGKRSVKVMAIFSVQLISPISQVVFIYKCEWRVNA